MVESGSQINGELNAERLVRISEKNQNKPLGVALNAILIVKLLNFLIVTS